MRRKRYPEDSLDGLIKRYRSLSTKRKLDFLENMRQFFSAAMSPSSKNAWRRLKKEGW